MAQVRLPGSPHDEQTEPRAVTSPELETLLADIAARPLSESDRRSRVRGTKQSVLDWTGPGALPDLALVALLRINPEGFFLMPPPVRLVWIQQLPAGPEQTERLDSVLGKILFWCVVAYSHRMTPEERVAFEARLREVDSESPRSIPPRPHRTLRERKQPARSRGGRAAPAESTENGSTDSVR